MDYENESIELVVNIITSFLSIAYALVVMNLIYIPEKLLSDPHSLLFFCVGKYLKFIYNKDDDEIDCFELGMYLCSFAIKNNKYENDIHELCIFLYKKATVINCFYEISYFFIICNDIYEHEIIYDDILFHVNNRIKS